MTTRNTEPRDAAELRRQAEEQVRNMEPTSLSSQTPEEIQRVFHELRVHQIELEMQNEELRTAQARIEADQKRRLDSILRGTNVGTWEWNVQSGETIFNERWAEISGYTLDELSPTSIDTWMKLCHSDDLKESERLLNECFEGKSEYYQCECRMKHKDGSCVWVLDRGKVFTWTKDGRPEWMYGTHQDVTRRKIAEKALNESEERFKGIYETSPIGIELYDAHGGLLLANPACLEIFDVSDVAEIKGFKLFEDPNVTDDVKARLSRGETAQYEVPFDFELVKKRSLYETHRFGTMDLNVLITPIIPEGKVPVGYLVHIQDITERVRLQQRLRILEKNKSLERMTGSIAHLFNNQLAAVIGNLELLSEDLPSGAIGSENLREAQTAAHRAADTSGLMLTFLGQSQGKPAPVDLVKACRQRLAGLEADRPMGAEIRCELPDSGPVIRVDRSHLDQMISAIVTNAWESLDKAGEIRVSINTTSASDIPDTHRFPLDWEPNSENYACLRVADTGCGMNETTIGRIFDPFFTDKFTGRGLGLAVVLGILRASEGCVTVESEPGRGSVFQVMWPLSSEDAPSAGGNKSVDSATMRSGGTILLVYDRKMVGEVAKDILNRFGFEVLMAKDGKEAVDLFSERHQSIRLVLTDLTMPRLNGWDTLKALRRIRPDIPVILASGYDANSAFAEYQGEQPQAFLSKPYRMDDLKRALARALGDIASD